MFNNQEVLKAVGFNREASWYSMYWDVLVVTAVILLFAAIIPFSYILMVGDWDFWIDWRDRQFWPLVTPVVFIWYAAALSGIFWENFRLPIGATVGCVLLLLPVWLARWGMWHTFNYYPLSMITPAQCISGGLILDGMLLITRHYLATAVFGGFLFGFTFYFANFGPIAGFFQPVEHMGSVASVADVVGFTFPRTATPEYLRMIEHSTLRTFGDWTVYYTASFAGYVCVLNFMIWWKIGAWFARPTFLPQFSWVKKEMGLKETVPLVKSLGA